MDGKEIERLVEEQREYFQSGATRSREFRMGQLKRLEEAVRSHEDAIFAALKTDLGKSPAEAFLGEVSFAIEESRFCRKHLARWMRPKRVPTPLVQAIARSYVYHEPVGVVLILGPWNYPFQLLIAPLIGAIAAGNCAVLKPSELAPATSRIFAQLIEATFERRHVAVVEGGVEVSQALLRQRWDHIFYTGGGAVGKVVMRAASEFLTPVTLELGGKSPCVVDEGADIDASCRRIAWGKFFNAGQTCVAPDYVLVPRGRKQAFVAGMEKHLRQFFGGDPASSPDYGRIVNDRHFTRLKGLLAGAEIASGGKASAADRYLAPTLLTGVTWESPVMREEIFGPLLPILEYDTLDEAIAAIKARPKPLALYFFSKDKAKQKRILSEISFGGGCINDTLVHLANPHLPFGGVGDSGIGAYHGRYSFETFSHPKSVMKRSLLLDIPLRYPPYRDKLKLLRKVLGG